MLGTQPLSGYRKLNTTTTKESPSILVIFSEDDYVLSLTSTSLGFSRLPP